MTTPSLRQALEDHHNLGALLENDPGQAPSVCQTLNDLTHAQRWKHLRVLDLRDEPGSEGKGGTTNETTGVANGNILLCGLRPEARGLEVVWCCMYSDDLQTASFKRVFDYCDGLKVDVKDDGGKAWPLLKDHFLLAVYSTDATVVYYNIARGLVKPIN